MPNSPTTDEELREAVKELCAEYSDFFIHIDHAAGDHDAYKAEIGIDKIMSLISQHTAKAELRARIDEMKEAKKWASKADEVYQVEQQLSDSIVRLEHRLKELDNATE